MYNMSDSYFSFKINKINLEIFIIIGFIYGILVLHTFFGCCNNTLLIETFIGSPSYGDYAEVNNDNITMPVDNTSSTEPYQKNTPLPKNELFYFSDTTFKPECCPNIYSNSDGCACMTQSQINYLVLRGGNNVPYNKT